MHSRRRAIATMMLVLTLAAGCVATEPTATPIPPTDTPAPPTATPVPPTATAMPTPIPTEAPNPTPTPIPTPPPLDVVGLWKAYPLDGKDAGRRLIGVSQKADGGLEMMVVALDTTTQVWAGLRDIRFQEGVLHCTVPGWGHSRDVFEGVMQPDKVAIRDLAEDERQHVTVHLLIRRGEEDAGDLVPDGQLSLRFSQCLLRALPLRDVSSHEDN